MKFCWMGIAALLLACAMGGRAQTRTEQVVVNVTPQPIASFRPSQAFGAGVDGLERGDVARVYTPANVQAMAGLGYRCLTYRLRTELAIEAWHWNPQGTWSDPARQQGYWTSDAEGRNLAGFSNGCCLPRRGSTRDQAGNNGYSRMDDGDTRTFWKSSPYLDAHFTGESNALHPQWVVVDLGKREKVNALHVQWGAPYASRFRVEWWHGPAAPGGELGETMNPDGRWQVFPKGKIANGRGGDSLLRLAAAPVSARFVRVWLTRSASAGRTTGGDIRDRVGYAIRELGVGALSAQGQFHDHVRRAPRRSGQTVIYASSTDPWHSAANRDAAVEQPGWERVLSSPLTHGLPLLAPVGVLYDTPDNAAALLRFLQSRGVKLRGVELGEEPDGQDVTPEDYGALYLQCAAALRRVDPHVVLGGPSLQTDTTGWACWPDAHGSRSWMNRFVNYLARRGHRKDLQFFSLEWYPFDDVCAPAAPQLRQEPMLLAHSLARLYREGVPRNIPCLMTEYGYSAFAGQVEMELPAALLNTEIAAQFLTLGGATAYLYGIEPNEPIHESDECPTWGNLAALLSGPNRQVRQPLPAFWAERLLTQEWAQPQGDGVHALYATRVDLGADRALITAYAVHRPEGQWAILLICKDPARAHRVSVRFATMKDRQTRTFAGRVTVLHYGRAQYAWHPAGPRGFASPDLPPTRRTVGFHEGETFLLPPYSLTVVRGRLDGDAHTAK